MTTMYPAFPSSSATQARARHSLRAALLGLGVLLSAATSAAGPVVVTEAPWPGKATFTNSSGARIRHILVQGDTIYVGGNFTVTQDGVTRTNLAAFDLQGNLRPAFSANPNGIVWSIASDGKSLFVGGEFTRLGLKKRLASLDLVTGAVNERFTAHVEGNLHTPAEEEAQVPSCVRSLAVITDASVTPPVVRLFVGGNFTQINSIVDNRAGLAALDLETGDLDAARFTQGVVDGYVTSVIFAPAKTTIPARVFIGGYFNGFVGKDNYSLGALDLMGNYHAHYSTGSESVTYPAPDENSLPTTVSEPLPVIEMDYDPVSERLFTAIGGKAQNANCAGGYDAAAVTTMSGRSIKQLWKSAYVGGDVQSVHYYDGNVFFGFHDGLYDQPDTSKMAVVDATTGKGQVDSDHAGLVCDLEDKTTAENCWLPVMDAAAAGAQGFFGVWDIRHFIDPVSGKARLLAGGEFTQVAGIANTARFAIFPEPEPPPPGTGGAANDGTAGAAGAAVNGGGGAGGAAGS